MTPLIEAPSDSLQVINETLERTRQGRRWQRMYHAHEHEVWVLSAVHEDVRSHLGDAAGQLAAALSRGELDPATIRATAQVLDDLNRLGTGELRHTVSVLREELPAPRACSTDDLLG